MNIPIIVPRGILRSASIVGARCYHPQARNGSRDGNHTPCVINRAVRRSAHDLAALSSLALDPLGPVAKGSGMSKKLSPDDRLDREAERIARKVSAILYSFRLVGDGFAGDFPDVSTLWERIGRRLAEYECGASDRGPLGQMENIAFGALGALDEWHEARGERDGAPVQERRKTIRLATVNGMQVA